MGKDAREAKRVATQQAAAAQPDMGAAFSGLGKQMVLVPAMWLSQKIDFTKEGNLQILFFVFSAVMIGGYLTVGLAQRRVLAKNDTARVAKPGMSMYLSADDMAADGSVSVCAYDKAKLGELKMQFVFSVVIAGLVHLKWGYTQPLVIMSLMQPMQMFEHKAIAVHLRGMSGPGYERPWEAAANNPLAAWAEKKREESMAEDSKKKD